ncbi:hypothetical protein ACFUCV_07985 [Specibacter sp. NPDC057265]|uniref:hypothetical protein n=1 Tax=Specibacter sp. NPDC057265 TaxID=3346075 RepID=UPI00362C6A34
MIGNFLRPPRTPGEYTAELLRIIALLGVMLAAVFLAWTDAAILAFALPAVVAPRFLGMRLWADLLFTSTVLLAAGSNVFDLYTRISWWDVVVHFACTGVLAAGCYILLAALRIVPDPRAADFTPRVGIVLTTTVGLALCALWEIAEWLGYVYISDEIYIAYVDTIVDMIFGALGSLVVGFAVAYLPLYRATAARPLASRPRN